jgi:hypothetical protein
VVRKSRREVGIFVTSCTFHYTYREYNAALQLDDSMGLEHHE